MKVTVSSGTTSIDDEIREDVCERIYFTLSRFSPRIDNVAVHISEVAKTSNRLQWLCRLSVRMNRLGSFSSESIEDAIPNAVSRAASRAAKQLERILDRQRNETRPY